MENGKREIEKCLTFSKIWHFCFSIFHFLLPEVRPKYSQNRDLENVRHFSISIYRFSELTSIAWSNLRTVIIARAPVRDSFLPEMIHLILFGHVPYRDM